MTNDNPSVYKLDNTFIQKVLSLLLSKTDCFNRTMSFKIRANHDRAFAKAPTVSEDDLVEEIAFFVDEDTGEIVEEKQMVPRTTVPQPSKSQEVKFIGLAMRKKCKASFM